MKIKYGKIECVHIKENSFETVGLISNPDIVVIVVYCFENIVISNTYNVGWHPFMWYGSVMEIICGFVDISSDLLYRSVTVIYGGYVP